MPKFGTSSLTQRATLHPDLKRLVDEVIKHVDFSITCGYRNQADQDAAVTKGLSQVKFPNGKHNTLPSKAMDVAPYPINWNDTEAFTLLAGVFFGAAAVLGIKLRLGADWDGDFNTLEHSFKDRPHIELAD
jgi:hypothetical protein